MPSFTLNIRTDANGYFQKTENYNPPGPFDVTVTLSAKLLAPNATEVRGELDIDPVSGSPGNQKKSFMAKTGVAISLGSWRLDGGDNVFVVSGKTLPPRPNTDLKIELIAAL